MTIEITSLGEREIEERLRLYESHHAEVFGAVLTSAEFYERFTAGEFDTPFGMAWATYFEAHARMTSPRPEPISA